MPHGLELASAALAWKRAASYGRTSWGDLVRRGWSAATAAASPPASGMCPHRVKPASWRARISGKAWLTPPAWLGLDGSGRTPDMFRQHLHAPPGGRNEGGKRGDRRGDMVHVTPSASCVSVLTAGGMVKTTEPISPVFQCISVINYTLLRHLTRPRTQTKQEGRFSGRWRLFTGG